MSRIGTADGPVERTVRLEDAAEVGPAMQLAVTLAVRVVVGADAAAVSLVHRGGAVSTSAASDDRVRQAEQLQHALADGPLLSAVWDESVVHVPDVGRDERWPAWSRAVRERSGYRSVLVSPLSQYGDCACALALYSTRPDGFEEEDVALAADLAAHVATTIRSAQEVADLRDALRGRTALERATGILMERYAVDADHALAVLARISSLGNRTMHDVAEEIASTGTATGLRRW